MGGYKYGDDGDALWRLRLRHLRRALACSEAVGAVDTGFLSREKKFDITLFHT